MTDPFSSEYIAQLAKDLEEQLNVSVKIWNPQHEATLLESEPTGNADLDHGQEQFQISIYGDGTTTNVQICNPDGTLVGDGVARRRKGDRRYKDLGIALAAARAFQDAAKYYAEAAEEMMKD